MLVKLQILSETEKAYKIDKNIWIPKSILDERGLTKPYYQIKDWYLTQFVEKAYENKLTEQEINTINSLKKQEILFKNLPVEVLNYWGKYWNNAYNSLPSISTRKSKKSYLNHYNDIGAMNDLSFQDVYGDFGY